MKSLTIKKDSFTFMDNVLGQSFTAKIRIVGKRALKWGPSGLEDEQVCQDEAQIQPGYSLAYDLDVLIDDIVYRWTIHAGVIAHGFKPYLEQLSSHGLWLENVPTRIDLVTRNGRTYPEFSLADGPPAPTPQGPCNVF